MTMVNSNRALADLHQLHEELGARGILVWPLKEDARPSPDVASMIAAAATRGNYTGTVLIAPTPKGGIRLAGACHISGDPEAVEAVVREFEEIADRIMPRVMNTIAAE